jgi:hypothetical protein
VRRSGPLIKTVTGSGSPNGVVAGGHFDCPRRRQRDTLETNTRARAREGFIAVTFESIQKKSKEPKRAPTGAAGEGFQK